MGFRNLFFPGLLHANRRFRAPSVTREPADFFPCYSICVSRLPATQIGGRPPDVRRAPLSNRQPAYKPGSGWHAGTPACVTAIPLGRRLPGVSSNLPGRADLDIDPAGVALACGTRRAVPIRSCSRWGLPCRRRCRRRGALLPHRFTLAAAYATLRGGLFSVALSLGSHPPDVIRHRLSTEPGLSSPAAFRLRRSGRPAD